MKCKFAYIPVNTEWERYRYVQDIIAMLQPMK